MFVESRMRGTERGWGLFLRGILVSHSRDRCDMACNMNCIGSRNRVGGGGGLSVVYLVVNIIIA